MISYDEALHLISQHLPRVKPEQIALGRALNRVTSGDVVARHPSPRFDNSAVDGFAVGSLGVGPWHLVGTVPAGKEWPNPLKPGEAVRIMTGAPVPAGTVAVFMQEDAEVTGSHVRVEQGSGKHIRRKGEEYAAGAILVPDGTVVTPTVMSALAAIGHASVSVQSVPKVGILVTGSELVCPGAELLPGQIYESNSVSLAAWLGMMGCEVEVMHVADDPDATGDAVCYLSEVCDLLITTGGVCHGDMDFVRDALEGESFETVFEGVAIKPGRPIAFGVRGDNKAWFGLPGNPFSSFVTFALFVMPWLGRGLSFQPMRLGHEFSRRPGREEFVPAQIRWNLTPEVWLAPAVGSHATASMVSAQGLVRLPAEAATFEPQAKVLFAPLPWGLLTAPKAFPVPRRKDDQDDLHHT